MKYLNYFSAIILFTVFMLAGSCCTNSGTYKRTGEATNRKRYRSKHSFTDMIKWLWEMKTVKWPEWIKDAVKAHIILNSVQSIGVHYATFAEHPEQAIYTHEKDLSQALRKYNIKEPEFRILKFGQGIDILTRITGKMNK